MSAQYPREYPYEGEMLTIAQISERTGIPKDTIRVRLRKGMPFEKAFSTEDLRVVRCRSKTKIYTEYKGEMVSLSELAERVGIKEITIRERYKLGDRGERLARPLDRKSKGRKRWYD